MSFSTNPVTFEDLVDVDSFIEYYLVNEAMYNTDASWGSIYMHKAKDGKLKFGPLWDFDYSMSSEFDYEPYDKSEIYLAQSLCILREDTPLWYYAKTPTNFMRVCSKWEMMSDKVMEVCSQLADYKATVIEASKFDAFIWRRKSVNSYCASICYSKT